MSWKPLVSKFQITGNATCTCYLYFLSESTGSQTDITSVHIKVFEDALVKAKCSELVTVRGCDIENRAHMSDQEKL